MSLYLPPPVRPIAWVAGASWPDGDEDKMWAVSRAWDQAHKDLAAQVSGIESAKSAAMGAFPAGDAADQIGHLFDAFLQGDQSLATMAEGFKTISDSTFDVGTELQSAKINIIVSLCILLVEIAWAWLFPPTAPAVEAAAVGTTRSIVKFIADALQNALERAWSKLGFATRAELNGASRYWIKHILSADTWKGMRGQTWKYKAKTILPTAKGMGVYTLKFGEGALWAPVTNAIVQGAQIADGKRHGFNWKEFGASWAASALSTIPSRELGRYMGFGISNLDKKFGGAITNMPFRSGFFLQGATIGATAGVLGNVFGNIGAGAVTGDIAGAFSSPEGWVGAAGRGGMVGGIRGLGTKTTGPNSNDPRFNLWMNQKAPWAPPKTPPANNPLTPRPVPGDSSTTNSGGGQVHPAGGAGNPVGNGANSSNGGGGFRDPSDPNYMTPSRPAPAPPVNAAGGGHGGGAPTQHGGGPVAQPAHPHPPNFSRPFPSSGPQVNSGGGHGGGGNFRDPSDPNYMTPSRPAPAPPVNAVGGSGNPGMGGGRTPLFDPMAPNPNSRIPAPLQANLFGGDGTQPHPSTIGTAHGDPNVQGAPKPTPTTRPTTGAPNFSRPFTDSSGPAPAGPSTQYGGGPVAQPAHPHPPNFSRPIPPSGQPVNTGGGHGGGFRDPSDPNFMTPSRPAPAPPVNSVGGHGDSGYGGGFRDPSDPNYMTPTRPAPAPPGRNNHGGTPNPADGSGDHRGPIPLGPGKDYRAKTRPKRVPDIGPMPGHYDAPDAPDSQAWIDAAEPPAPPPDQSGEDPNAGDPNVDKPLEL